MGYFNDPRKTEDRFVDLRISSLPSFSMRAYRTGDLAWFDENGNMVLMGRQDMQVKRYGLRIDISEIEALLHIQNSCFALLFPIPLLYLIITLACTGVAEVVVFMQDDVNGSQSIVAIIRPSTCKQHQQAIHKQISNLLFYYSIFPPITLIPTDI